MTSCRGCEISDVVQAHRHKLDRLQTTHMYNMTCDHRFPAQAMHIRATTQLYDEIANRFAFLDQLCLRRSFREQAHGHSDALHSCRWIRKSGSKEQLFGSQAVDCKTKKVRAESMHACFS